MTDQPVDTTATEVPTPPPAPAPPQAPAPQAPPAYAPPPQQAPVSQTPPQQVPVAPQAPVAPPQQAVPQQAPVAPATPVQPAQVAQAPVPAVPVPASPPAVPAAHVAPEVVGLEDVDSSDLTMPYINIIGKDGVFEDSLSNERFESLDVVLLGMAKQRVLWPPQMEADGPKQPLCRSRNFTLAVPGERFRTKFNGVSPMEASGFTHEEIDAASREDAPIPLECVRCGCKEWGSNPTNDRPWCTEQHVWIVLMEHTENNFGYPAILTVQRSAMKASKNYITSFARSKTPFFTVRTTLTLNVNQRGEVVYSVPKFTKGTPTDPRWAEEFAAAYRGAKDFLQSSAPTAEEGTSVTVSNARPPAEPIPTDTSDEAALPF